MAGERDEHVVQRRPAQPDVGRIDARRVERADRLGQRPRACRRGQGEGPVGAAVRPQRRPRGFPVRFGHLHVDDRAAEPVLQLVARSLADEPALVDDVDAVGELVGLVQILRGQEHRGPGTDQGADQVPHLQAAARIDAGGRLVQKQHLGPSHQRRGQVEAPLHAARIGSDQALDRVADVD